jgi:hypothetical protein
MPDGKYYRMTSKGINETCSHETTYRDRELPPGSAPDKKHPGWILHPTLSTDWREGSYYLCKDGTISFSGGLDHRDISREASLVDTGQNKNGKFWVFANDEMKGDGGREFETPCRVYRLDC